MVDHQHRGNVCQLFLISGTCSLLHLLATRSSLHGINRIWRQLTLLTAPHRPLGLKDAIIHIGSGQSRLTIQQHGAGFSVSFSDYFDH